MKLLTEDAVLVILAAANTIGNVPPTPATVATSAATATLTNPFTR